VSVKSVNHRFLDLKLRLPEDLICTNLRLPRLCASGFIAGTSTYMLAWPAAAMPIHVNRELVQAYLKAADELRLNAVTAELDVVALLRLPGVIGGLAPACRKRRRAKKNSAYAGHMPPEALGRLDEMRRAEGRHLVDDLAKARAHEEITEQVRGLVTTLRPAFARSWTRVLKTCSAVPRSILRGSRRKLRSSPSAATSAKSWIGCVATCSSSEIAGWRGRARQELDFLLQKCIAKRNTMLFENAGVESEALTITGIGLEIKAEI